MKVDSFGESHDKYNTWVALCYICPFDSQLDQADIFHTN